MIWVFAIAAVLVIGAGVMVAQGRLGQLPEAEPDRVPDTHDGEPAFDLAVRGYRMDEVDARIALMQAEITRLSRTSGPARTEASDDDA